MPLLVVRHAHAGRRSTWEGEDAARPLSPRGRAQAEALVPLLAEYRPRRILASPAVRCFETVRPLAESLDLPIESVGELAEGNGPAALHLLHRMAGETAVLSTHGDIADEVLDALTPGLTRKARYKLRLLKGEVWVIQSTGDTLEIVDHLRQDPRR
ncbi:MAG TPA: phosphoglycerate mutase family protein [Acidimicrobiales bacterium]